MLEIGILALLISVPIDGGVAKATAWLRLTEFDEFLLFSPNDSSNVVAF
jgi:hypothetical protein